MTPGEYVRVRLVATPARLADGEHGLRLALARTIAAFAGGAVQQLADADAVRLDLRLPRVFTTPRPEPDAPRTTLDVRGGEALLLVDDDAVVRPILATVLRHLGYDVHVADDLDAAVQSLETGLIGQVPSARIALALVSTALSGPERPDALRRLRTCLPDLRVLWIAPHAPAAFSAPGLAVGRPHRRGPSIRSSCHAASRPWPCASARPSTPASDAPARRGFAATTRGPQRREDRKAANTNSAAPRRDCSQCPADLGLRTHSPGQFALDESGETGQPSIP